LQPDEVDTWKRALLRFRAEKDEFMRQSRDSPFSRPGSAKFVALRYFEPDPAFRFESRLERYPVESSMVMATSKGTRQLFNRVGRFNLLLEGDRVQLQAYQSAGMEDPSLFIPFRDATSGRETYPSGRYLDMKVEHDDNYLVDFNYAYNPYCAYNEGYVCPLPPRENWLKVAMRAGEMTFHD
jgi:uncharacterized protein